MNMKTKYCLLALSFCFTVHAKDSIYQKGWIDFNKNGTKDVYEDPTQPIDKRIDDLLRQMTVEEKTCQMATLYGYGRILRDSLPTARWKSEVWKDGIANIDEQLNGIGGGRKRSPELIYPFSNHAEAINTIQRWFVEETRLGIPVDFSNEGIHGLNHTKATPFPAPISIGSTWNKALVYQAGEIAGKEAKALGYTNVYAPILDVARDPRWGRVLECYGEDPFLVSELGRNMVDGLQDQGVASTLKHFAVYSVPKGGRDGACRTDPHVAPRELHEIYLYPFKRVIEKSHPKGVMSSYNDWDGIPVTASYYFLTELLRQEYGFRGYVVSDSEAVEFVESKHHVADSYEEAVRQVVEAGMNVRTHFTPPADYIMPLRKLIREGKLSMKSVDRMVTDVLRVKFELGLFDSPYVEDVKQADKVVGADLHRDFVLDMQQQSLVLLKNENKTLPLDKHHLKKILVTGPLAKETNYMISRYGPQALENITVYDGICNYVGNEVEVAYSQGCTTRDANWPDSEIVSVPMTAEEKQGIAEAVKQAADCDVIIAVLGEDETCTGESKSRTELGFPGRQQELLEALYATGKPVVLVLVNGQPLTINWADRNIPAILETWFPGQLGGEAIANTLFGTYNPGGKLSVTFPKTIGQIEFNFPFKPGSHAGQYFSGPNGSGNTRVNGALYPFGYGLSYTNFNYSGCTLNDSIYSDQGTIVATVEVENTGKRDGKEVVQLYVRDKISSVSTPIKQLKAFKKVFIKAGEKKKVTLEVPMSELALYDVRMKPVVEPGEFEIQIGSSSDRIHFNKTILVK